ncbi:MAG TPA: Tad domain-containing protein [Acidimicrobiia bacterium]
MSSQIVRDERGATLLFVALSMVMLLGFAAFAIDTGALYEERRSLQNGADAAVIAIAEDCARGLPCNFGAANATAAAYADLNADDGAADIDELELNAFAGTIRVITSTETSGGGTVLQPIFAQFIGFNGATVTAEASAAWGGPEGLDTLPLVISACELNRPPMNGDVNNLDLWPGFFPSPPPSYGPVMYQFHSGTNNADDCNAQAGQDADGDGRLPGGFGWLDPDPGSAPDCAIMTDGDGWADGDPGASPPGVPGNNTVCSASWFRDNFYQKFLLVPWFDDVNGLGGSNARYHIEGYVGFFVTGYNFGGQYKENSPCGNGSVRCVGGYLFRAVVEGVPGGPNQGVVVFGFTG